MKCFVNFNLKLLWGGKYNLYMGRKLELLAFLLILTMDMGIFNNSQT